MKTCFLCLDSVEESAISCPSCGEKFSTPVIASPESTVETDYSNPNSSSLKERGSNSGLMIRPLVWLYALVGLALAVLVAGSLIIISNNSSDKANPESNSTTQPTESDSPIPTSTETETPPEASKTVTSEEIELKIIQAGICDLAISQNDSGNSDEIYITQGWADGYVRECLINSDLAVGPKIVTIYSGPVLPEIFRSQDALKVFEVAIVGPDWTVVTNYYPAKNKTYQDDVDIQALLKLLGGRTMVKTS